LKFFENLEFFFENVDLFCDLIVRLEVKSHSWLSALLMEETGGPGETHRPVASH
jgi:hypothetical protein